MSPRLGRLSGREVIAIRGRFGFQSISQRGSHVKLRRVVATGKQTLTVPAHDEVDAGTLVAIFRQASKYVAEEELRPHFYAD